MDLLEHPTPSPARPVPGAAQGRLPASQAILALSFGCSMAVFVVASLVSALVG